jgi:hypothetical protein
MRTCAYPRKQLQTLSGFPCNDEGNRPLPRCKMSLRPSGRPPVPDHWKRDENRLGKLLKRFRARNDWAGQTTEDWARACPELWPVRIGNSVWTNIETGKSKIPSLSTFEALGIMNELLAGLDRGHITDRLLRKRVYEAEPITGDDGRVWTRHDFFDLYINKTELPTEYQDWTEPARPMTAKEAADATECIRLAFRDRVRDCGCRPQELLSELLALLGPLEPSRAAAVEGAVFGMADLDAADTPLIQKALAATGELACP